MSRSNFDWLSESEVTDTEMETFDSSFDEDSDETELEGFLSFKNRNNDENIQSGQSSSIQTIANPNISIQDVTEPENDRFRCPVCLIPFDRQVIMAITCGHVLCKTCIDMLSNGRLANCPVCKRVFRRSRANRIFI